MTYLPKTVEEMDAALALDGPCGDLVTRLSESVCGGQGPEADRVARRVRNSLPPYLVALRDHELREDHRTTDGRPKGSSDANDG